jgi:hypothetical protein
MLQFIMYYLFYISPWLMYVLIVIIFVGTEASIDRLSIITFSKSQNEQ